MTESRNSESSLNYDSAVHEAATIVHRKLGTSKRFAESDKKNIAEILVSGLSALHEKCQVESERLNTSLEAAKKENKVKKKLQTEILSEIIEFAKKQGRRLESHAHDMTTTTEFLIQLKHCQEKELVQDCLEKLLLKTSKVLQNMDSTSYEKDKCLRLLKVPSANVDSVSLVDVLQTRKDIFQMDGNVPENNDELIENLTLDVEDLTEIVEEYREGVSSLKRKLKEADEEITRCRHQLQLNSSAMNQ